MYFIYMYPITGYNWFQYFLKPVTASAGLDTGYFQPDTKPVGR